MNILDLIFLSHVVSTIFANDLPEDVYKIMIGSFLRMSSTSNFMQLISSACVAPANGTLAYDLQIKVLLTTQSYAML